MAERRVVRPAVRPSFGRKPTPPPGPRRQLNASALRPLRSVIILALALMGLWSIFSLRSVSVSGNQFVSTAAVQKLADASFDRHPFSRNLITLGLAQLEKELPAADQRIKEVSVSRRWPGGVVLEMTERQPLLAWKSGVQVFALDVEGVAVSYQSDVGLKLPVVEDSTNLPVKIGDRVVPARFVSFATGVIATMPKKTGLQITGLRIPDTTSELYVVTSRKFFIKFDTTREVDEQVGDLKAVLDTLSKQNKTPAEYIDLRIAGKAYYK